MSPTRQDESIQGEGATKGNERLFFDLALAISVLVGEPPILTMLHRPTRPSSKNSFPPSSFITGHSRRDTGLRRSFPRVRRILRNLLRHRRSKGTREDESGVEGWQVEAYILRRVIDGRMPSSLLSPTTRV